MIQVKTILFYLLPPILVILGNWVIQYVSGTKVNQTIFVEFFINFPAERLVNADTLFLFEILDFNHQALLYKDNSSYDKDYFYRIAWGYLRPIGVGKNHIGITKIELYQYKFNNKKQYNIDKTYIPSVYYDFIWNNHEKY